MKLLKKSAALLLAMALTLSLAACGARKDQSPAADSNVKQEQIQQDMVPADPGSDGPSKPEVPVETGITMKVAAMTGPTGMGLAQLLEQFGVVETMQDEPLVQDTSAHGGSYNFMLAATADQISPLLIKGELDAACVPANLAANLYQKTNGEIVALGINTLGVLYIVDKGDSIHTLEDLKGKTIVSAGKGAIPEYGLRHVLMQNGIDPDNDLTIEWKSEQNECVAALASGAAEIAMMPQPFVTVAQNKIEGLRVAIDLTAEWDAKDPYSTMLTGVVVARKSFIAEHRDAVDAFLLDYADSVAWVNENNAEAAAVIGEYGIVAADVAEKALPYCNIVCITDFEMLQTLSGYLAALYEQERASVGNALPDLDFYYRSDWVA